MDLEPDNSAPYRFKWYLYEQLPGDAKSQGKSGQLTLFKCVHENDTTNLICQYGPLMLINKQFKEIFLCNCVICSIGQSWFGCINIYATFWIVLCTSCMKLSCILTIFEQWCIKLTFIFCILTIDSSWWSCT